MLQNRPENLRKAGAFSMSRQKRKGGGAYVPVMKKQKNLSKRKGGQNAKRKSNKQCPS